MIDTVRTLAQPYSHYLMSHRDLVIVLMGLVVMWTVGHDLLTRWRIQRLNRDEAGGRTDPRSVVRRTYATAAKAEKAAEPEPAGGLPPIRGGRTYARNLGNALQKAGIGPTPVYTPPAPAGWGAGPMAAPGRGAPPPQYAPPPAPPWATPGPPMQQPVGPRPAPAPAGAGPWPTYVPPAGPAPASPAQPSHPFFQPPFQLPFQQAASAAPPAMPPVGAAPALGVPLSEPVPPPLPTYAPTPVAMTAGPASAPVEPPTAKAKPKRKRFSLSVLQNLEKTLQRTTGFGETAPVAEPPSAWTPPPATMAPPAPISVTAPAAEDEPVVSASQEEEASPAPDAQETTVAPHEEAAPASPAADYSRVWEQPQPAVSDSRAAMRAMLFGEDEEASPPAADDKPTSVTEPAAEPEEPVFRFEPVVAEPAPSSHDDLTHEETSVSPEPVEAAAEAVETPAESTAESLADPWRTEPPAETAENAKPAESQASVSSAPDESETQVEEPLFSSVAAEPAPVERHGWAPPERSEMPTGGDRGTLVIIEDDQTVAEYYATLFRGNGYTVHVASDGISGVDICAKVKPRVILLDVMMPRQNGMLVLQTLRASDETKETPVVVLSNFSEPTLVKRALQLGALEYVIKTQVEGAALLEALPRWMNREKAFAAA
ncbi:MAG: response regulator [Chloroflexi bacterium]|nr:MAG: response regulator [Chloroflexota bacterium]